MRPQVKSTIIWSLLGLSLAMNAALGIGQRCGAAAETSAALPVADDECLLDRLELDVDQQRRLDDMRRRMHELRADYRQRADTLKADLAESISATRVDRAVLAAQLDRYAENQAAMQRAVAAHLLGVGAMLRPGQRDAFRTLLRTEMFRGLRPTRGEAGGAP
jgi:hypothetical protein